MNVETELNDTVKKSRIQFNDFSWNGEEGGDMALFAGKDKVKTVMRDILLLNNARPEMYTIMTLQSLIYIQSVTQSVFNDQRPLGCSRK